MIAARAALRVLPLMISSGELDREASEADAVLLCFRATAVAWASGTWPSQAETVKSSAVAASKFTASRFAVAAAAAVTKSDAAAVAVSASVSFANHTISASDTNPYGPANAATAIYKQVSFDVEFLEAGSSVHDLGFVPLWKNWTPPEIRLRWDRFRNAQLKDAYSNWNVWIHWYEDRLSGAQRSRPIIEALEIARVLIPDEDWEKGPEHVNAVIQRLEDEYRRVDPSEVGGQELIGTLFRDDGPEIDTSAVGRQQRPTSSEVAEDFHASLREALESLIAATDIPGRTSNRFTDVTSLSRRLLEALGSGPASVRAAQTIAQAGKLDRAAQADDRRRDDPDLEGPALSADEREALDNAVDAAKTYINTDPLLGPMEQARLGKAQIPIDEALARNVVDTAADEGAATEDAREAVEDAAEAGPAGTKSRFYGATVLNFMRAALRIGAKYSFAAKAGVNVARWLVKHKTKILTLLEPWPDLRNVAERIIALLEKLPLD